MKVSFDFAHNYLNFEFVKRKAKSLYSGDISFLVSIRRFNDSILLERSRYGVRNITLSVKGSAEPLTDEPNQCQHVGMVDASFFDFVCCPLPIHAATCCRIKPCCGPTLSMALSS